MFGIVAAGLLAFTAFGGVHAGSRPAPGQAPAASSPAAEAEFEEAQRLMYQGLLQNARAAVLRGLKEDPRSIEGYNLLGIIYGQQKEYTQAKAAFEQALRINPHSTVTHNNLGNSYVTQNQLDLAEKEFRVSLRLDAGNRDANFNLGSVLMARGHPEQAIALFRAIQPPDSPTQLKMIQAYLRSGRDAPALELARKISAQGRDDVRLHFSLGVVLASERKYSSALHELELADALRPGTFEILHDLGQAYLRHGDYGKAETVLDRALALRADSADTLYLQAQVYNEEQKKLQALELLLRARKLAPQNTDIIFLMGRLSMMQNYFEDAIEILEQGVKIAPRRADLRAALGESYFSAGKVDRALQEFQTLVRLDPSARSYAFLGLAYRHLGRFEEAKKYFKEGLQQDPRNSVCLYNLGYIENKQGNYAVAEKLLEEALRINPDYDDALYEMATIRMGQKRYEEALPLLKRCTQVNPKPSQAYYKLATAERDLHQSEAAQRDMKIFETLAKDPSSGPYPLQHFFDFLSQRAELPARSRAEIDLTELQREVEQHPGQPRSLYLLAEAYLKLGRADEARKTVAQLDQLSGGDARTMLGAGVLLARYKMHPEAVRHFQSALAADPTSDDAKYNLANAYFQMHEYAQAFEIIAQVSPLSRSDDAYLALLGDIDAHLGRTAEALRIYEQAIVRNPDNEQDYLALALTHLRVGNNASAGQALRQGLKRIPDSGRILWGMGVFSALEGRNAQAEEFFRQAVDLMPEWESAYSALGMFYFETGQPDKARETLERYVKVFPNGGLDVNRVRRILSETPAASKPAQPAALSPEARMQFLQLALALADPSS